MEQFVRAYTFEPYNYFKVVNKQEIHLLKDVLEQVLINKPEPFKFNLNGVKRSADVIEKIHNGMILLKKRLNWKRVSCTK